MTAGPVVLAVDGGGSKTDVLAVGLDGGVVAWERGGGSNPQVRGWPPVRAELHRLRDEVLRQVGERAVLTQHVYLAGLDLPEELAAAAAELAPWSRTAPVHAENDLFPLLRAGTASRDAVAVVCGTGINAIGVRADGTTARFPSLGEISGDWGGGADLGTLALWHAARSEDGRGPRTSLQIAVAAAFELDSVRAVAEAVHLGRVPREAVTALTPLLFAEAEAGDRVACTVVDRQAEEIVLMAAALLRRLELLDRDVQVVLGGSVLSARAPRFVAAVLAGLAERAPQAQAVWVASPPVTGAALLALEAVGASPEALARATATIGSIVPRAVLPPPRSA